MGKKSSDNTGLSSKFKIAKIPAAINQLLTPPEMKKLAPNNCDTNHKASK
jgi:hypothetical protein